MRNKSISRIVGRLHFLFVSLLVVLLTSSIFSQNAEPLIIESEPNGAQVFIDAVYKGVTPLTVPQLPAGDHMLVIYKEQYENHVTTLTQTQGALQVKLRKHKGQLNVNSTPLGADIYLDSAAKGTSPLKISNIDIGKHKLRLEKSGYQKWEEIIEIAHQETLEINAELASLTSTVSEVSGSILIISEPAEANIFFDGEAKGDRTPLSLPKVAPGTHELEIIKDGYQIYHTTITVSSGKSSMVTTNLIKDIFWPMFRHDAAHSGYINTNIGTNLQLKWKFQTGAEINSGIAVIDNFVYVASQDRFLYCLNVDNGAIKWKYEGGELFSSSPAIANGLVFIGNDDDYVHAVDAKTGQVKWKYLTGGDISSSPIIIDNIVYVGSFDRYLYALNAQNGAIVWKYAADREVWSAPAVFNQVIYFGAIDGYVYAIDTKSGTLRWKYKTGGAIKSSPAIQAGTVFVGSDDGYLYAIDANQGTVKWQFLTEGAVKSSPAIKGKKVIFGSDDNHIYCVNLDTESLIWKYQTGNDVSSSPALTNDMVVIGSWDKKVYNLDINSGKELWKYTCGGAVASSPAVVGKMMFIGSKDNNLYAFEEK